MGSLPREIKKTVKVAVVWIFVLFFVLNPFNSSFVMSVNSQEFITYHLRDIIEGLSKENADTQNYYIATGTYEKQKDGDLFGVAKNKNLIVIQVESLQNMVIGAEYNGKEITPNLNNLINEKGTIYFDNFYQQIGSGNTSDAEFSINNSLIGSIESFTYQLYEDNYFKGLPWILKDEGYQTVVLHGYDKSFWNREKMYPVEGFDRYINDDFFISDNIEGIGGGNIVGISDSAFFQQASKYLEELNSQNAPFYSFLITLSSHNPFRLPESLKGLELKHEDKDNIFGNYMNSVHYADKCLGEFLESLKANGLYDNSLIAIYGDHFGLTKSDDKICAKVTEYLGYDYDYDMMLNVPLFIHVPESNINKTISTSGGQLDFMPTIAYLLGIEELDTIYLGQNLLTADSGFVAGQTHLLKGSFIKDDLVFEMSRDGIFENSRAFHRITREQLDITPLINDYKHAKQIVELSNFYLKNDILRKVLLQGKTLDGILSDIDSTRSMPTKIELVQVTEDKFDVFIDWMKKNPEKTVLLTMDDLLKGLQKFEEEYSGTKGRPGIIKYVNSTMNSEFLNLKNRIIPVLYTMDDYTKIEYLGYDDILLMPDLSKYTRKQIADILVINKPCAIAIKDEKVISEFQYILDSDTFVYTYDIDEHAKKAFYTAIGVDGFIERTKLEDSLLGNQQQTLR